MSLLQEDEQVTSRPIRVAYVVYSFHVGGIERCVARLAKGLDRHRFAPLIICLSENGAASKWIERDDVPIVELHKPPRNSWKTVRRLADILKRERVDVVHSHNWGVLIETVLARRQAQAPVHVHTEHGQGLHEGLSGLKRWIRARARRWAFGRLDQLLVCAESVRPLIHQQCWFPVERISFLPNGVDEPPPVPDGTSSALRRQLGIPPEAFVAGSTGRLAPVKNFGNAIAAVRLLVDRGIDAHLVLVGDGPEEQNLRNLAREQSLADRVHLVGRHPDVYPWLAMFDAYINCSHSEAMSLAILEAMAAERPIVVTDVGDNRSLVDGPTPCGLVVAPNQPAELADALFSLIDGADLRRSLGRNASDRFESRYSTPRMVSAHAELYSRLSKSPRVRGSEIRERPVCLSST